MIGKKTFLSFFFFLTNIWILRSYESKRSGYGNNICLFVRVSVRCQSFFVSLVFSTTNDWTDFNQIWLRAYFVNKS